MKKVVFFLFVLLSVVGCNTSSNKENNAQQTVSEYDTVPPDLSDEINYSDFEEDTTEAKYLSYSEAEQTVYDFLTYLDKGNFKEAFDLTKNPAWGTYEQFSSDKGFGSITAVKIYFLRELYYSPDTYNVLVKAYYEDPKNGSNTFVEIFKLKDFGNDLKITGLTLLKTGDKLLNAPRTGFYEVNIGEGGIEITNVDTKNKTFDFEIGIVCPTLHTAEQEGTAVLNSDYYWEFYTKDGEFTCQLKFYFFGNSIIIEEVDCSAFHGVRCYFDGVFNYKKDKKLSDVF